MKKFQKLFALKQIVKAQAELAKYNRLTRKQKHESIYDQKRMEAVNNYSIVKDVNITSDARLIHIAYSLLKGKQYPQIESSVRYENCLESWEWKSIIKIMELYKDEENLVTIPTTPYPTTTQNIKKLETN